MKAGPVSASMLLASFLGSEHEKIGQEISQTDFAGELGKQISQTDTQSNITSPVKVQEETSKEQVAPVASKLASGQRPVKSPEKTAAGEPAKTSGTCERTDAAHKSRARIQNLKKQAQNSETLYITNPVLAESILAKLQCPAETIKAFKSLQNKDGWISLADFKALLANQPANAGSQVQAAISSADAKALLGSIVQNIQKGPDSGGPKPGKAFVKSGAFKPALSVSSPQAANAADASCSIDGFRAMIDQVIQKVDAIRSEPKPATAGGGVTPVSAKTATAGGEITGTTLVAPKQGQTTNVTSNSLPSFLLDAAEDRTDSDNRYSAAARPRPEETGTSLAGTARKETRTNGIEPGQVRADKGVQARVAENSNFMTALGLESDLDRMPVDADTNTNPVNSQNAAVTAQTLTKTASDSPSPIRDIRSLLQEYDAEIVSTGTDKPITTAEAVERTTSDPRSTGFQMMSLAAIAKDTGILKDEPLKNSQANDNSIDFQIDGQLLKDSPEFAPVDSSASSAQTENGQEQFSHAQDGDRSEAQTESNRNPVQASLEPKKTGALGEEQQQRMAGSQDPTPADDMQLSGFAGSETSRRISSASIPGSSRDPREGKGESISHNSDSPDQSWVETTGAKPADSRAADQIEHSLPVSSHGPSLDKPALRAHGHDAVLASKEVEKQLKDLDTLADPSSLQGAGNQFQDTRIQMQRMDQSPDSTLNYYDPARSAELVERFREHSRSMGAQQLTLEMDSGEFGKMSVKVGALRDEVSAVLFTESEPARQVLLKNSPELRQELQNQGLQLGKFTVDIDREKAGRENAQQWQRQEGKDSSGSRPGEAIGKVKASRQVYTGNDGNLSQVNIFA